MYTEDAAAPTAKKRRLPKRLAAMKTSGTHRKKSVKVSSGKGSGLKAWEARRWAQGFRVVAGTDEAGRGPWAGPVVAAAFAVLAKDDKEVRNLLATISDSKRMTAAQRHAAYLELIKPKFRGRTAWAISQASREEIDTTDILQASLSAMARSVRALSVRPDCVLVDGCNRPPSLLKPGECWTRGSKKKATTKGKLPANHGKAKVGVSGVKDWLPRRVEAVISGDAKVPSIAAASVLAKVHRDLLMEEMDKQYPMYGFSSHKGYGTAEHQRAIKRHGVSMQHRRSFAPVAKVLLKRPAMVRPKSVRKTK